MTTNKKTRKHNGGFNPQKRGGKFGGTPRSEYAPSPRIPEFTLNFTGVLSVSRGGTGFVNTGDGNPDIMIPAEHIGQALNGDTVEVALDKPAPKTNGKPKSLIIRDDTRRSGRITRIVERSAADIVCTLRHIGKYVTAVPMLPNHKHTFNIEDPKNARENDRVIVRMTAWPNPYFNPEGEIVSVIGPADNPGLDTLAIIAAWNLPGEFPNAVVAEAEKVSAKLFDLGDREDLRDLLTITIDPATARDFDDALSLSTNPETGDRTLGVHIADVSHFVEPGSALDREAVARGVSVYLPDKVIPMLPEQLSNGICSLAPDEDRFAFSVFMTFNRAGRMTARRFTRSVIRSKKRLTYEEAQEMIDGSESAVSEKPPYLVRELHRLAQQLRANRFKLFALNLNAPEMEVVLDANGMMTGVHPAPHSTSHELVEEAMVAANEAVAAEISARRIPYISRSHEAPDEEKIAELQSAVTALGLFPGDLNQPNNIMRLLKAVAHTPLETYVSSLVLKSMKRAEYAVDKEGHFGLAKRFYAHFTSPIRRYPDLVLHRQLAGILTGDKSAMPTRETLVRAAKTSTELEFRAEQAERDLIEIKKYRFLEKQLADGAPLEYDAVAVAVLSFGAFVDVPELQVGGMIHISTLSDKFVRYDSSNSRFANVDFSLKPGDKLRVIVTRVNFDERKVDFAATQLPPAQEGNIDFNLAERNEKRRKKEFATKEHKEHKRESRKDDSRKKRQRTYKK
ncbi:MAG: VacB/RNase II family 3'-5' exoribonuclease [Kiritimatiellaeota bacterium]|nr:VacB/RNase II family 3'-5' exoribonuclease [Kiritimatiellota bacterium]